MKNIEYDKYLAFYTGFGTVLKEGLTRDWANREKVADLLLFEIAQHGGRASSPRSPSTSRRCRPSRRRSAT